MSLIPHHTSDAVCARCAVFLERAHADLNKWFNDLKGRHPNVHIDCSYRDEAAQDLAFQTKKSNLQWPKSAHNKLPSWAVDIFQIDDTGKAIFDPIFCAKVSQESLDLGYQLRWGGTFKALGDNDHFELVNPHEETT